MQRQKQVKKTTGYFYFEVYTGSNAILIRRDDKTQAVSAFGGYQKAKKRCVWHGKWNGKKFELTNWESLRETA